MTSPYDNPVSPSIAETPLDASDVALANQDLQVPIPDFPDFATQAVLDQASVGDTSSIPPTQSYIPEWLAPFVSYVETYNQASIASTSTASDGSTSGAVSDQVSPPATAPTSSI